jgi:sec-independent protein translocase protein TatB
MIEISLGKLVLLALIALIVLGPEKLPGAARTAGALLRRVRSGWDNVRAEVERELEIEQIKRTAREAAAQAEAVQTQLKDQLQQVHDPLAKLAGEVKAGMTQPSDQIMTGPTLADGAPDAPDTTVQGELPLDAPAASPARAPHDHA